MHFEFCASPEAAHGSASTRYLNNGSLSFNYTLAISRTNNLRNFLVQPNVLNGLITARSFHPRRQDMHTKRFHHLVFHEERDLWPYRRMGMQDNSGNTAWPSTRLRGFLSERPSSQAHDFLHFLPIYVWPRATPRSPGIPG